MNWHPPSRPFRVEAANPSVTSHGHTAAKAKHKGLDDDHCTAKGIPSAARNPQGPLYSLQELATSQEPVRRQGYGIRSPKLYHSSTKWSNSSERCSKDQITDFLS